MKNEKKKKGKKRKEKKRKEKETISDKKSNKGKAPLELPALANINASTTVNHQPPPPSPSAPLPQLPLVLPISTVSAADRSVADGAVVVVVAAIAIAIAVAVAVAVGVIVAVAVAVTTVRLHRREALTLLAGPNRLRASLRLRGTPINRLPIMAKSVLDLYELYNLVIARGGLVDVINKKLWQEIIKGLHLPSSITSAAFTLRTQYMKYLYPYECEKRRLSTPAELQAAIDGNRREGRRSSYGTYAAGGPGNEGLVQRNPPNSLALRAQMSPLSLVTAVSGHHAAGQSLVNGHSAHANLSHHHHHHHHHAHHAQHAQGPLSQPPSLSMSNLAPSEFEARMVEYELRNAGAGTPPPMINRQGGSPPPPSTSPKDTNTSNYEMSRLTLWGMYGNNNPIYSAVIHQPALSPQTSHSPLHHVSSPEPQREALDLGLRSSPVCSSPSGPSPLSSGSSFHNRKENEQGPPAAKRLLCEEENPPDKNPSSSTGTHIKICNRGIVELNGVTYQGVLFAQTDSKNTTSSSSSSSTTTLTHNENGKTSRSIAS
ncbi:protein dead ringer-like isoform X1 [Vespula squamosa]|uniref:Protein dead ringer-like isoform X1 n=1 Tax=Vespula squamosa TaxID=30214 RepID=A0ABD1ZV23_VESSQ